MNKRYLFLLPLLCLVTSCGKENTQTKQEEKIEEEDKIKPTSTDLEYIDHAKDNGNTVNFDKDIWYRNDLDKVNLPDPDVILGEDGYYYIYGTTDRTGSKGFDCYSTINFNSFTLHQDIYDKPSNHWASDGAMFAPEIRFIDGTYYLYYSDYGNNRRSITVLTSSSPSGPFVDYVGLDADGNQLDGTKEAIFKCIDDNVNYDVLDQTIFIDDDKEMYMYWSVYETGVYQYIQGAKMKDPVTLDMSTLKTLVYPGEAGTTLKSIKNLSWEAYQSFRVAEGPYMIKSPINNKYYLTYSVNHYPDRYYTVCYAYSSSPLGDFKKPYDKEKDWEVNTVGDSNHTWTNLVFGYAGGMKGTSVYDKWEGFMSGTGHHCFFKIGDQYMIGYHAHKNRKNSDAGRAFAMDRLYFDSETGAPYGFGPTYSVQMLPKEISGLENVVSKATILTENIENPMYLSDKKIVEHYNLTQENYMESTLLEGESYVVFKFDKEYEISALTIYNSVFYDKYLDSISYISFGNNNNIIDPFFRENEYVDFEKEFIRPGSGFTYQFDAIKTNKVIIGFDVSEEKNIGEIEIYAK